HDAHRLAHLLHAHEIAVVAVAVLADRDVEIELGIAFVGLRFAQIPGSTGAAHHDTRKPPTPGVRELDHGDIDIALLEDTVFRQQSLDVVADLEEGIAKRPDVVEELRLHHPRPAAVRDHSSALAQDDCLTRPPRDCIAPYGFGQYVVLDPATECAIPA